MSTIDKLYANCDWDTIINKCSTMDIRAEKDNILFYYGLALHHRSLFEKSIQVLDLLEFKSDYFCIARLYNGLSSMSLGNVSLAGANFLQIINSSHKFKLQVLESTYFNYSSCMQAIGMHKDSIKYLKEAIKMSPKNGIYYSTLLGMQIEGNRSNVYKLIEIICKFLPSIPIEKVRPLCELLCSNGFDELSQTIMIKSLFDHEANIRRSSGF